MTARSSRPPGRATASKRCAKSNFFDDFPRKLSRSPPPRRRPSVEILVPKKRQVQVDLARDLDTDGDGDIDDEDFASVIEPDPE